MRLFPIALVATGLILGQSPRIEPALAGTCTAQFSCGAQPIRFIPGRRVTVQVVNQTSSLVLLERVQGTSAIPLRPGQNVQFERWGGTEPNISIVFWDQTALPLKVNVAQPNIKTLRIVLRPGGRPPGDRSVYILNDGRVKVY